MSRSKQRETKQQPSMLPGPTVPGCCLVSFRFLCDIHSNHPVIALRKHLISEGSNLTTNYALKIELLGSVADSEQGMLGSLSATKPNSSISKPTTNSLGKRNLSEEERLRSVVGVFPTPKGISQNVRSA